MIINVVTLLLLVGSVALAVILTARAFKSSYDRYGVRVEKSEASPPLWPWGLVLLAGAAFIVSFGFREIPAGHVGVVSQFGEIQDAELPPGLHWVTPVINNVTQVNTQVRAIKVEGYTAASREQQDLFMNLTLNYSVDPERASDILQNIGTDFETKVVTPRFLDIPKSVTDDYGITTVLGARDDIRATSEQQLTAELEPFGFVIVGLNLENFGYSNEYNAAIEARARAEQEVQTELQKLEQERVRADQAEARAEGAARARVAEAQGEAEANRLLAESLSPALLQWQAIQRLQDNISIALVPSDGGLILDIGSLDELAAETPAPEEPEE